MKKFLPILTFVLTIFIATNVSATTNQYIEYSSGETDENAIYLDSYEEYLNALKGVDEQELYKEEYLNQRAQEIANYDATYRTDIIEALVLETEDVKEYYSYDNYGLYKISYQPIKVQVLEGEYKNQTFETSYVLTVDTYENIDVKPIKANQKINVVIYETEGEASVYAITADASVKRVNASFIMIILAILFIFIYLGNKGFKVLPQLILLADLILIIFVPEMIEGRSIIWMSIVTILAYMIVDTAIKVGVNAKMFASILTTITMLVITTLGLLLFNNIASMSGIFFEATSMVESFPKGTIDFYNLNLALYILMATIVISDVSCKTIKLFSEKSENDAKDEIKEYVSNKISTVSGLLLITIMPKYLYMLVTKYTVKELLNSEMLTNEIVRILFLIIAMTATTQVGMFIKKIFIKEKKNKNEN